MFLTKIIDNNTKEDLQLSKQVVLYGAGNFAKECLVALKRCGYEIIFIIDQNKYKDNLVIDNIHVISIDDKRVTDDIKNNSTCILSIFNAYVDLSEIEENIRSFGFSDIVNPLQFIDMFHKSMGDHFWLTSTKKLSKHKDKLFSAYEKLEDEHSKKLFQNIVEYRFSRDLSIVQKPQNFKTQYIPDDIVIKYPPLNFIDCGAYDGDTIMHLINNNIELNSFVAFEPDTDNIAKLSKNLKSTNAISGFIYPCGVYGTSKQLRFSSGQGSASHIDDSGDVVIQVVSMDEVLLDYEANFIKMDIEGAEIDALLGAEELIRKNKPILAISAYHKFDDLWTITDLISSWNLGYKFYLRLYEYNGFGLVYYAYQDKHLIKRGN